MFRRQSIKSSNNIDNYKPHDFESNKSRQIKSPSTNERILSSTTLTSQSYLCPSSSSYRKRQDITSSSCGGDSGVSDCESSSHNHNNLDLSMKRITRLSNIRSLRSFSNTLKKTGLIVQDLPLKNAIKNSQIKSQLSISSNSAFTQIIKKTQRQKR
jgi:hypothetical protein